MIDPVTQLILENEELDRILEGYQLKCALCGRVIEVVKDSSSPLLCCNQRMFVMSSNPPTPEETNEFRQVGGPVKQVINALNPVYQRREKELVLQRQAGLQKRKMWNKKYAGQILQNPQTGELTKLKTMQQYRDKVNYKKGDPLHRALIKRKVQKARKAREANESVDIKYEFEDALHEVLSEAGFSKYPRGWKRSSVKKFGKSLVKGGAAKKGFFDKCVEKMKDKVSNPEGFCASVKDETYGSTAWRGKGKSPQEVGKDIKKAKFKVKAKK